jgi:hypothetical protein
MNSDKRLIRTADGKVAEDDGNQGGSLIVGAGGIVPESDEADVKAFLKPEAKEVAAPPENKAVQPPERKMMFPPETKGRR